MNTTFISKRKINDILFLHVIHSHNILFVGKKYLEIQLTDYNDDLYIEIKHIRYNFDKLKISIVDFDYSLRLDPNKEIPLEIALDEKIIVKGVYKILEDFINDLKEMLSY